MRLKPGIRSCIEVALAGHGHDCARQCEVHSRLSRRLSRGVKRPSGPPQAASGFVAKLSKFLVQGAGAEGRLGRLQRKVTSSIIFESSTSGQSTERPLGRPGPSSFALSTGASERVRGRQASKDICKESRRGNTLTCHAAEAARPTCHL